MYARTFHSLPTIRASLTTLTFNVYLLHPTVHFIATLHFYSTHDESLVRGDFQSIFFLRVSLTFSRKQVITRVRRMRSEKEGGHEYDGE